jgi:hypothetical protein
MNKFAALLLTVLVFLVVGPAIGVIAVFIGSGYGEIFRSANHGADILFRGFGFVLFFGYIFGWAFALIAGVVVAVAGIWMRWNNFLAPVAAALIATLSGGLLIPVLFQIQADPGGLAWFFPACLLAAFICWLLTRGIVRRTWLSA